MADFLNIGTGKPEALPPEKVPEALASGTHIPVGGDRALLSPGGDLELIPKDQLQTTIEGGYKVPSQGQLTEFANLAKYSGTGNTAKAFGLGALRGASFGASDAVKSFLDKGYAEEAEGLKTYHPFASTAGEVAGAVGSALAAPEASPAGLVSKLGHGVTEGLAGESALSEIAAHAAGMSAEGALYGAGQSLSEKALGDPDATAEHLVANVGLGALIGGGLGGVFKAGALALPKSVDTAKDALSGGWRAIFGDTAPAAEREPFFEMPGAAPGPDVHAPTVTPEGGPETKAGIVPSAVAKVKEALTGTPAAETLETFQRRAAAGEVLTEKERAGFEKQLKDALQETHDATEKVSRDASSLVRPQESEALLEHSDPVAAQAELQRVKGVFDSVITEMRTSPELYPARFPAKLTQVMEGLERGIAPESSAADVYAEITRARKVLDDKIPWNKEISGEAADAVELTKQLRSEIKASLQDQKVWGEAAARTSAFNDSVNDRLTALKEFRKQFMMKTANRTGGVTWKINPTKINTFLNQINDPRGQLKAEALKEFFRTNLRHIGEMEASYKAAPFESFDKAALERLIEKNVSQATKAQDIVAGQPGLGYGGMHNLFKIGAAAHFGGPLGAAAALGKSALNPNHMAATLANIEAASQKVAFRMSSGMRALFKPVASTARKGFGVIAEKMTPAEKAEKIKAKINETQEHLQSAENLAEMLHRSTEAGAAAAPETMASVQQATIRGLQFLQSKIPPTPETTPFEEPLDPPLSQLQAFDHYYRVVHDPLSVLDELKSGMLQPESVETLQAVYPKLYQAMQAAAVEHVADIEDKSKVPYRTRLVLSQFMGQPLDASLAPQAIQAALAAFAMPQQNQPGMPHPTATGMQKLNLAGKVSTDFQRTSLKERDA